MDLSGVIQLYLVACDCIRYATRLDAAQDFAQSMNQYFMRMIFLAAFCILRISKSDCVRQITDREAEETYFMAVAISKKRSVEDNDMDAKGAKILTQLWSSETVFRGEGGHRSGLRLDLRERLVSS